MTSQEAEICLTVVSRCPPDRPEEGPQPTLSQRGDRRRRPTAPRAVPRDAVRAQSHSLQVRPSQASVSRNLGRAASLPAHPDAQVVGRRPCHRAQGRPVGPATACRCQHQGGWKFRPGAPVSLGQWLGPRTLTQVLRCGFSVNSAHSGLLYVTQAWALLFLQRDSSESSCGASLGPASTEMLMCVTHECFSTYCVPGLCCVHERQRESCPMATPRGSHCVLGVMMTIWHEEKPHRVPELG